MSSTNAADSAPEFVDTNVFVYSYDRSAGRKRELATQLLDRLWVARTGCLSLQILQEFYVAATGRLQPALTPSEAASKISALAQWRLHRPGPSDLLSAIDLHQRLRISFWDAMIVQSSIQMGCKLLWTEDLNDGQSYAGVTARNPFAA